MTSEKSGTLTHDATYLIRVPENWNGVLLNDLDYAGGNHEAPSRAFLFDRGYALSGTSRIQTMWELNLEHQVTTLDIFEREFGRARQTVQFGCSGGGSIALSMAERHADRIEGSIAMCGASSPLLRHLWVDFLFTLRALLDPGGDLGVLDLAGNRTDDLVFEHPELARWDRIVTDAASTPLGRARIALVVSIAQWPTWSGGFGPATTASPPDPDDLEASQRAMVQTARTAVAVCVPFIAGSALRSYSNADLDVDACFHNADPVQRRIVRQLYAAASADAETAIIEDLRTLAAADRIVTDPSPADDPDSHAHTGRPDVPLLHVTTMDSSVPPVVMQGHAARAASTGRGHLYRQAFVERANHCGFSVSETAALVETMMTRLSTGDWPSTDPESLNALAATFGTDDALFVDHRPPVLNRPLFADA